jgi:outer membrane protein assembly complex protein YaeT
MVRVCVALLACLLCAGAARADVADYLGKPVVALRVEAEGRPIGDRTVLGLLETGLGRPLLMRDVRASVAHLFSLGRFSDVVVHASLEAGGVGVRFELVPAHPIERMTFLGITNVPGLNHGDLRRAIVERFGASPPAARAGEMSAFLASRLQDRGYRRAAVTSRVELEHAPERGTLVFVIGAGERTRINGVEVAAPPDIAPADVIRRLGIGRGTPYQPDLVQQRVETYVEDLKRLGHYNARVAVTPALSDNDRSVLLTVSVVAGPRVRLEFRGDPLPPARRGDLVPIAREGAVDEDLLEDSAQRIHEYLRSQGYRDAAATFTRDARGDELVITFTVTRGPLYRVGRVEVTGNAAVTSVDLAPALRIREGQAFSAAALEAEVSAIQDIYARRGYSLARAVPQVQTIPGASDAQQVPVAVRIDITENVRTIVNSVRVQGNQAIAAGDLTAGLALQPGQPFFVTLLALDRDAIQLRYANEGFRNATVSSNPGLSADAARADLVFTVEEGPRVFVDHVLIVGNDRTRTETIRRELQFKTGDPLGLAALTESQRRLAALGLFRRTRITELGHGVETSRDVLVSVEEAPATTIGYGGGVEAGSRIRSDVAQGGVAAQRIEFAPRAFFEIGRRNLFGKNRSVNLFSRISLRPKGLDTAAPLDQSSTSYGFSEYRVVGTYREPRLFNTAADAFLTGTLEQQRRSSFNFARRGFNAEVVRRLTRQVSASGSYQIQRTELFDERFDQDEQLLIDRLFPQVRLSSFSLSTVRDGRDDLLDPTRGTYHSANAQLAARHIGSEVGFIKTYLTSQLFHAVPQAGRVVFAASARVGLASGFPRQGVFVDDNGEPVVRTVKELPASERFFAGGDTTVRGFAQDQLGTAATIDAKGFPNGGNALVILNAELRLPVRGGLGVVGFFDTGNVFAKVDAIDFGELRSAVGFGVRYRSPVGPIRVDIGFKVNRRDIVPGKLEDLTAVHISLGQAF